MRGKTVFALCFSLLMLSLVACGPKQEPVDPSAEAWAALQTVKADFDALRADLADAQARLEALSADAAESAEEAADEVAAEAEDAAEAAPSVEELEASVAELEKQVQAKSDELGIAIVTFLNSSEMYEGEELTPEQKQAFNMKAEIDIQIAQGYIEGGGDYKKAIDIYDTALRNNPDNELLLAAKAEAERLRYMDEERFAQVKKGMTTDEVRELLGTAKPSNRRDFPEKDLTGWFYPKDGGGAAGVYFREKKKDSGVWTVYALDFDAVKPQGEEEAD